MIDLILIVFTISCFYGGFWCGKKFGTFTAMFAAAKAAVKELMA